MQGNTMPEDDATIVASLVRAFDSVPDPRGRRGRRYPLPVLLAFLACGMVSGARSLYRIQEWAADARSAPVRDALGMRVTAASGSSVPSIATLSRLLSALDIPAFEAALIDWAASQGIQRRALRSARKRTVAGRQAPHLPGAHIISVYRRRRTTGSR